MRNAEGFDAEWLGWVIGFIFNNKRAPFVLEVVAEADGGGHHELVGGLHGECGEFDGSEDRRLCVRVNGRLFGMGVGLLCE